MTARLPAAPAAVPIYSGAGDTRVLVVDLDASRGGVDAVRRDATAVGDLVGAAGGRVISDESPSGGMHVYVPLEEPIGFHDVTFRNRRVTGSHRFRAPGSGPGVGGAGAVVGGSPAGA